MVAYSFQRMFTDPIRTGRKPHTIRGPRKRHARPDEALQLYAGMRTVSCFLIARATCQDTKPIDLHFRPHALDDFVTIDGKRVEDLDAFAYSDGFDHWMGLRGFWEQQHGLVPVFQGVIVYWKDLVPG